MTTTKSTNLLCLLSLTLALTCPLQADTAFLTQDGHKGAKLSPSLTDFVRENLIHIFDSSNFHQMEGGVLPVQSQEQIEEQLQNVKSGSYVELELEDPTKIIVEGVELKVSRMWASVRESDGFVYDWILQQPDGDLVALQKARGELIVQFAPHMLRLLKPIREQGGAVQPTTVPGPKQEGKEKPKSVADGRSK